MAGVKLVHIPYKGSGQSTGALLSGEVQCRSRTATSVGPHLKSGRVKVLAVTTAEPDPALPGLTTVAAAGLPGYEAASTDGVFVRRKTRRRSSSG